MAKQLDLTKSVYELTQAYPELIDIMKHLGFTEITSKPILHSVGKIVTIPKGAAMKNISMAEVVAALMSHGFELTGQMPDLSAKEDTAKAAPDAAHPAQSRQSQLKAYLRRLGEGEALESVRADFVRDFGNVDASEIMEAEQALMQEGTPLAEVQRLCDVHSALFHGATAEEIHGAGNQPAAHPYGDKNARAAEMAAIPGHPLHTFTRENDALRALLDKFKATRDEGLIPAIRELSIHFAKKGDLLYPLLKVKYGISGPSDVMWTVDMEIRDALGRLAKAADHGTDWHDRLDAALQRAEEMIYKEQNILFPICAVNFTQEEWYGIYRDAGDYSPCFGVQPEAWGEAERATPAPVNAGAEEVVLPGGHMTLSQLGAMLNTIPLEITFVDAYNMNRYFNEGPKVFKRPAMAIDREVFSCHPANIEPVVRQILDDFRNRRRDEVSVWMEKGGRTMLVRYLAVRDKAGQYLGAVEVVQDMEFAKEHFQRK